MNLRRLNSLSLFDELNRAFHEANQATESDNSVVETSHWAPAVDIKENAGNFTVYADLPGVEPEDIDISMEDGVLTVKGERNFSHDEANENYTRTERVSGSFYRRFTLPETADSENITATHKNGVLALSIPKMEKAQPRRIQVTGEV